MIFDAQLLGQGNSSDLRVWVERVRGIEPPLSAWEAEPSCLVTGLTWQLCWSGVTVADPSSPWLMAR